MFASARTNDEDVHRRRLPAVGRRVTPDQNIVVNVFILKDLYETT
jgi:hypothetical protein